MTFLNSQNVGMFTKIAVTPQVRRTGYENLRLFRVLARDSAFRETCMELATAACNMVGFIDPVIMELALVVNGKGCKAGACHIDADLPDLVSGIVGLTGYRDVIMEATGESFRLRPADVLFFPSRLKHFGGADILRGIRAEELQSITEAETIAHRNGFWAIALHFYVYERSVPPASSTTLQAALKETKMCENLESIL